MDILRFPENLQTSSGLMILLNGIISLPDVTSFDKITLLWWLVVSLKTVAFFQSSHLPSIEDFFTPQILWYTPKNY